MLIAQHNPIKFYSNEKSVQEFSVDKNVSDIVFYPIGTIPAFELIASASTTATVQLYDYLDNAIDSPINLTVESETGYKRLIYLGSNVDYDLPTYVKLKITNGSEYYYSDIFAWAETDTLETECLKFRIESADLTMGWNKKYLLNMTNLIYEFYLSAKDNGEEPTINQNADESQAITLPSYGTCAISRSWNIDSNRQIFIYLSSLGLILANGLVTLTWNYETFTANQIDVSKETDHNNDSHYQLKFTVIDSNESISICNKVI